MVMLGCGPGKLWADIKNDSQARQNHLDLSPILRNCQRDPAAEIQNCSKLKAQSIVLQLILYGQICLQSHVVVLHL